MTMTAWRRIWTVAVVGTLAGTSPARADITAQTPQGFVSRNVVIVAGTPAAVWKRLITPSAWWSGEHTFSGDAANLTLDPTPGGCFCETLPAETSEPIKGAKPAGVPRPAARGGVVHMHVVFIDHAKALRLVGALGPLQSEAVNATLTITLTPVEGGTRVIFEYVVGGYMRYPPDKIAAAVDTVMGKQLISLAQAFGPARPAPGAAPAPDAAPAPADDAPVASSPGVGLDKNGLLVPRGRVWSLPASGPPAPAAPDEPLPNVAPLPTAAVPQDEAGAGTPVVPSPPDPAPVAPAKSPAKSATKPENSGGEPSKSTIDAAFDAAFRGAPPPASPPTP